jgi:hypothetical protein
LPVDPNATSASYAYSDLLEDRRRRPRRASASEKICSFCGDPYEPQPYEKPARTCCVKPACERQRESARRNTPRPLLVGNS